MKRNFILIIIVLPLLFGCESLPKFTKNTELADIQIDNINGILCLPIEITQNAFYYIYFENIETKKQEIYIELSPFYRPPGTISFGSTNTQTLNSIEDFPLYILPIGKYRIYKIKYSTSLGPGANYFSKTIDSLAFTIYPNKITYIGSYKINAILEFITGLRAEVAEFNYFAQLKQYIENSKKNIEFADSIIVGLQFK